ncbi:ABC transporter ATP-binding protein [Mangrovicoccus sp. HB161399]|uniref:ABC transporter ATP-binding protein n=1 Tax=Mangrovicoccus sp. HB161399 TaxID=2720392 RepID=UPI001557C2AB|nr:ABC transporter ATP-binding protein [Mangrovicoccus sp. HB161399]
MQHVPDIDAQERATALRISGLKKSFGDTLAVKGVSLDLAEGGILALLGPSGCGKTTILRMIAGFAEPDSGTITLNGRDITRLAPEKRNAAMVFQSYALFPHMTVAENVGYGLKIRRIARGERETRVWDALKLVRLDQFARRYPSELSGGQQQRTALARAIATRPDLLLLDEPFGALDQNLREAMQIELRKLQESLGLATVIVTHDQQEAMILADRIAVVHDGRIEQLSPPAELYDHPRTRFVAEFMGVENILDASLSDGALRIAGSAIALERPPAGALPGQTGTCQIALRAEAVTLARPGSGGIGGTIGYRTNLGGRVLYEVSLADGQVVKVSEARAPGLPTRPVGQQVALVPGGITVLEAAA